MCERVNEYMVCNTRTTGEKMPAYVLCERVNFFPSSVYFTLAKHVSHAIAIYLC